MLLHLALDNDFLVPDRVAPDELQALIVVSSPEEWDSLVGNVLVEHVEGDIGALLQSDDPMFDSST